MDFKKYEVWLELFPVEPIPLNPTVQERIGVIDDDECVKCSIALRGKDWSEVNRRELFEQGAFFVEFLSREGLSYYLPLFCIISIENPISDFSNSVEALFTSPTASLVDVVDLFTSNQKALLFRTLEYLITKRFGEYFENCDLDPVHKLLNSLTE